MQRRRFHVQCWVSTSTSRLLPNADFSYETRSTQHIYFPMVILVLLFLNWRLGGRTIASLLLKLFLPFLKLTRRKLRLWILSVFATMACMCGWRRLRLLFDPTTQNTASLFLEWWDSLLLHKVLEMHVVTLEIFDQSYAFWFDLGTNRTWLPVVVAIDLSSEKTFRFHREDRAINWSGQGIESSRIRHAELQGFFQSLLNRVIVTKSLPLGIYRIDTTTREVTLLDKAVPVDLILVLFAWELLCNLKDFDKLSHSESSSLSWKTWSLFLFNVGNRKEKVAI